MADRVLKIHHEFKRFSDEELYQFLHRGMIDVIYRRERNERLRDDRLEFKRIKKWIEESAATKK